MLLYTAKGLYMCEEIKALEMGRWYWTMDYYFNVITMVLFRRSKKKEGDVTSESVLAKVMWFGTTTIQGMMGQLLEAGTKQGNTFSSEPPYGTNSSNTLVADI